MRFEIVGELRAQGADGRQLPLGPRKQRLLTAVLLCRLGETVPVGDLIDALWGAQPPASAAANLRSYVHRLRRLLGDDVVTGSGRPGYALVVPSASVDAAIFDEVGARGEAALAAGDLATARACLRVALGLWRGRPFADLADAPALVHEVARLEERRLLLLERRFDADLGAGQAGDLVPELTALVDSYPYRERFLGQLMLALYRSGRQADALRAYRRARHVMVKELGVEPGDELAATHRAMLRRDPELGPAAAVPMPAAPAEWGAPAEWAAPAEWVAPAASVQPAHSLVSAHSVVPAQLPPDAGRFTGRDAELASLDGLVAGPRPTRAPTPQAARTLTPTPTPEPMPMPDPTPMPAPAVVAVVGLAGVGKTALVVHWGRRAADRYPDGQLYIDLGGFSPGPPVAPIEALARFLRALAVPAGHVPSTVDEAAAMYRSLVAYRRMLVVLDNAAAADQVRPLLPGGPECVVLVTSRHRLAGLVAGDGARHLVVDPLPPSGSFDLIGTIVDRARVAAEPGATAELAALCGHLPLALRIAATNVAEGPECSIAEHVAALRRRGRLDALRIDGAGGMAVRASLDRSYEALTPLQQRLFRLLGLAPTAEITDAAAAALVRWPVEQVSLCLDRLASAHLVRRVTGRRFVLHDLVREYARELALRQSHTGHAVIGAQSAPLAEAG